MFVWFSFLALFTVLMLVLLIAQPTNPKGTPLLLLAPLGMALFGVALVKFGRWLGRNEESAILQFLKNTLEADDRTSLAQ